jgi:hypothetical protein
MQLPKDTPDHHDAELILKLYDLRREAVMRQSRNALTKDYWPKTAEEAVAPTRQDHPLNAAYRQVTGYWEMVYGMARHGIVHADYLIDNNSEGLFLFVRIEPFLKEIREASSARALQHTEWASRETEVGRLLMENLRARFGVKPEARRA